jgi:nicotinic acid mononucleotide adenylyltransferase
MTRLAIEEAFPQDPRVMVSDLHTAGIVGYGTIDLVDYFLAQPGIEPYVVLGQELLGDLSKWKENARLQAIARFIVIRRPGTVEPQLPKEGTYAWLQAPHNVGVLVSSTTLRGMLAKGLSCAGLLPPSVIAFCRSRGLYGAKT